MANPFPTGPTFHLTQEKKQQLIKVLLYLTLMSNFYIIFIRLMFSDYSPREDLRETQTQFTHGYFILQFIGEPLCHSKLRILVNDGIIFMIHLCMFTLCYTETEGRPWENFQEGDGSSGEMTAVHIRMFLVLKQAWQMEANMNAPLEVAETV